MSLELEQELEEKIQKTQLKIEEVDLQIQKLNEDINLLMKDLEKTPEQLEQFLSNPDNFARPIWELLQEERQRLDQKLTLELNRIRDPLKAKKSLSEIATIRPHWIFVR